jgi:protoporphyrinogen oxidase
VESRQRKIVIIGGGPAGLTAAYDLSKSGIPSVVLEKDCVVGGLARTVNYKGYRFDIGGHRFFTKSRAVEAMWREVLAESEFLRRPRLSRIYFNKRFFQYPLKPLNALFGLGMWNTLAVLLSYAWARVRPQRPERTFEQWVSNRFGKRLYKTFFKTYTEKVWGIPCSQLSADWAAQRIKGLSLFEAIKNAMFGQKSREHGAVVKTLLDAFDYPALGPGMMWRRVADIATANGCDLRLNACAGKIRWIPGGVESIETTTGEIIAGSHFISSMPIREMVDCLEPAAPEPVRAAAQRLGYRDFLTVALILDRAEIFPDNWIYIHGRPDPELQELESRHGPG